MTRDPKREEVNLFYKPLRASCRINDIYSKFIAFSPVFDSIFSKFRLQSLGPSRILNPY